ncbi:hypothetical protein EDC96DRAFT_522625 [Choanephora cucurbitarum]|nr:hypothetical protein EDC96DRAFT_522625 [Choanephora cucurbitarum]
MNRSISERWKQLHPTSAEDKINSTSPIKEGNDIKASTLKSIISNKFNPSPIIDVVTHSTSLDSVNTSSRSSSTHSKMSTSFNTSQNSLQDITSHFIESTDSLHAHHLQPSSLLFNSSKSHVSNTHSTNGSDVRSKWPIPSTMDEVQRLCEAEQAHGTSYSRLTLCLHLMESAFQVDPHNDLVLSSDEARRYSGMFSTLKLTASSDAPSTLGEAMVTESKRLLKQLACGSNSMGERAESEAQFLLGNCYGMGALGWPINHKRAFQWYFQASKYGHPEAIYRAAVCYELGIGTHKDCLRAFKFYKKAANLSHVPSMYKLGVILLRGYYGQPPSKREGINWLQRAACIPVQPGDNPSRKTTALPHALHTLALIHLTKECQDTSVLPDPMYAIQLLREAAQLGYGPSQAKLGECYECGRPCQEDEAQSIYWYTLAAQQDEPEACLALSSWYLTGALKTGLLVQSDEQAYLWARKAAKLTQRHFSKTVAAKAYFTLGVYHQNGIGAVKSLTLANKWYKKAAQYGHPEALKMTLN